MVLLTNQELTRISRGSFSLHTISTERGIVERVHEAEGIRIFNIMFVFISGQRLIECTNLQCLIHA
jgi:hypothetical protein